MRLTLDGDGPPVVQLPGLAGGVDLYDEERGRVVAAGFRVAALETSGDRASDPAPGPLSWESMAAEVVQAVDRLDTPRAILWGTSYGSLLAMVTAALHPERVGGLLLCLPPNPHWRPRPYLRLVDYAESHPRTEQVTPLVFRTIFAVSMFWEGLWPPFWFRFLKLRREVRRAATPASTVLQKIRLMWSEDPPLPAKDTGLRISAIVGGWDTIAPAGQIVPVLRRYPGHRIRRMRLVGHAAAYCRPRGYARRCVEELERLTSA